jgi:hypothetical protein
MKKLPTDGMTPSAHLIQSIDKAWTASIGSITGASSATNTATAGHILIFNYAGTTFFKNAVNESVDEDSAIDLKLT